MKTTDTDTDDDRLPWVYPEMIEYLRRRREWQNKVPSIEWDMNAIHRNIGANAVIEHLEELLDQQTGLDN